MKHIIILLLIIIIIAIFRPPTVEGYNQLLYPTKGLQKECAEKGYLPAYMPSTCIKKDGYFNNQQNCKCMDNEGYCTICYPQVEHEGLQVSEGTQADLSGSNYGTTVQTPEM